MKSPDYKNPHTVLNYDRFIEYDRRISYLREIINKVTASYKCVLDLACGTGAGIEAVISLREARIVGIDNSPSMIQIAKKKFKSCRNVTIKKMDLHHLDFPNNSFDLVLIAHAIRFVPFGTEIAFFDTISHILKPEGIFVVVRYERLKLSSLWNYSSINSPEELSAFAAPYLILQKVNKTKLLFHKCMHYFPSRICAYYFINKK